jgi:hypothetical protein
VDQPIYTDPPVVIAPAYPLYPVIPPVVEVPTWDSGAYITIGGGYYYGSRYGDSSYYRHYYDRGDWDYDRGHDWGRDNGRDRSRYGDRSSDQRSREQSVADHLAYRERKDTRDTQKYLDEKAYQDRKNVRAEEQLHARRAAEDSARSARQAEVSTHDNTRSDGNYRRESSHIAPQPTAPVRSAPSVHSSDSPAPHHVESSRSQSPPPSPQPNRSSDSSPSSRHSDDSSSSGGGARTGSSRSR